MPSLKNSALKAFTAFTLPSISQTYSCYGPSIIIEKSLFKTGRKDVTFNVIGFGEDQPASTFGNKYPEERFYNRTLIIGIIPAN